MVQAVRSSRGKLRLRSISNANTRSALSRVLKLSVSSRRMMLNGSPLAGHAPRRDHRTQSRLLALHRGAGRLARVDASSRCPGRRREIKRASARGRTDALKRAIRREGLALPSAGVAEVAPTSELVPRFERWRCAAWQFAASRFDCPRWRTWSGQE